MQLLHQLRRQVVFRAEELTALVNTGQGSRADLDMVEEFGAWLDAIDALAERVGNLISEGDSWRIANERLRERLDRHSMRPRTNSNSDRPPPSRPRRVGALSRSSVLPEPTEDFENIDAALAKLNESMKAARSEAPQRRQSGEFASIDAELAKLNQSMMEAASIKKDRSTGS